MSVLVDAATVCALAAYGEIQRNCRAIDNNGKNPRTDGEELFYQVILGVIIKIHTNSFIITHFEAFQIPTIYYKKERRGSVPAP